MLDSGKVLQERYRIVTPLGQGGMGAVYRAWDLRLKVPVAVKEMQPQPGLDAAMLEGLRHQFEQEAAILARLSHANLVRVTDYFEEAGFAYLVMGYVDGQSLADVIAQQGAQPEARVIGWAQQLLDALDYCHDQGVVHRDIKPQNIIIKSDGRVVLVDFGLVKLWDPTDPRTKTVMRGMGTPEYAPPEQYGASADHTGPPSDIYSVGATLYHALTGQAPPTATERMALPEKFAPLSRLVPSINPQTERVVMRALSLPQADRWHSARAMKVALTSGGVREERAAPPAPPIYTPPIQTRQDGAGRPPSQPMPAAPDRPGSQPMASPPEKPRRRILGTWATWLFGVIVGIACVIGACVGLFMLFPPGAEFELAVANQSEYDICSVYISSSASSDWGDNWLASGERLRPGDSRTFVVNLTEYDVLAQACDAAVLATLWERTDAQTLTVGGSGLAAVRLVNTTAASVCMVNISSSQDDTWGANRLSGGEVIVSGGERIFFISPGTYDMRAQDCSSETVDLTYYVNVAGETLWSVGD